VSTTAPQRALTVVAESGHAPDRDAYGSVCFASKVGQLAGNHFLTITENRGQLRPLGELVLWNGAQDILFETA